MSICEELTNSGIIQKVCRHNRYLVPKTCCTGFSTFNKYHGAPLHIPGERQHVYRTINFVSNWLEEQKFDLTGSLGMLIPQEYVSISLLRKRSCQETKPSTFYSQHTVLAHGGLGWPRLAMFSAFMYLPVALLNSELKFGGTWERKIKLGYLRPNFSKF